MWPQFRLLRVHQTCTCWIAGINPWSPVSLPRAYPGARRQMWRFQWPPNLCWNSAGQPVNLFQCRLVWCPSLCKEPELSITWPSHLQSHLQIGELSSCGAGRAQWPDKELPLAEFGPQASDLTHLAYGICSNSARATRQFLLKDDNT